LSRDEDLGRIIRHDVRSPLAVVLGQCELLLLGAAGPLTPAQADAVERIERQARRALALLDDAADRMRAD
jgi:signal transduction histidine kinase